MTWIRLKLGGCSFNKDFLGGWETSGALMVTLGDCLKGHRSDFFWEILT